MLKGLFADFMRLETAEMVINVRLAMNWILVSPAPVMHQTRLLLISPWGILSTESM